MEIWLLYVQADMNVNLTSQAVDAFYATSVQ